ncbi:MAG: hypothetical protein H6Q71_2309 [Firmicutes bacterium]|nr:hypothetical protein [Bacillota bacterium]
MVRNINRHNHQRLPDDYGWVYLEKQWNRLGYFIIAQEALRQRAVKGGNLIYRKRVGCDKKNNDQK